MPAPHELPRPAWWHQRILDALADVVVVVDERGRLLWANRTTTEVLGYEPDEQVGRDVLEWVHPDDREEAAHRLVQSLSLGYSWPIHVRIRRSDDEYVVMAPGDIDALDASRRQFVMSLRRLQNPRTADPADTLVSPLVEALHHVGDAVIGVGSEGQVVFRNRAATELLRLGVPRLVHPLPAGVLLVGVEGADAGEVIDPFATVRHGRQQSRREARLIFPDGSERLVEVTGEPWHDSQGRTSGGVVVLRDITELRRREAELRDLALRDALTGLANRTQLMARLRTMTAESLLQGGQIVVMFVDLDHFKDVNDTFDHLVGDEVLQVTARRLVDCVGSAGLVARFGGEEFVVVTGQDATEADALARRIVERLREPLVTMAGRLTTSCSVGLTVGGGATEPEQLLREADTAVYAAKRMGGATVAWYDRSQRERAANRLRSAAEPDAVAQLYQQVRYRPIVDLATHRVVAVRAEVAEAARPVLAAQMATDRRLVLTYIRYVAELDRVLREQLGPTAPLVAIPVPASAVGQRALLGELEEVFDTSAFPDDRRLVDVVSVDPGATVDAAFLGRYVAEVHVRLMVDDMQALQTALVQGIDLAVWGVRLPREVVRRLPDQRGTDRHLVRALVELARAHGAPVAADRVDTDAQRCVVVGSGVELAWGDALAPAVAPADLVPLLRHR